MGWYDFRDRHRWPLFLLFEASMLLVAVPLFTWLALQMDAPTSTLGWIGNGLGILSVVGAFGVCTAMGIATGRIIRARESSSGPIPSVDGAGSTSEATASEESRIDRRDVSDGGTVT